MTSHRIRSSGTDAEVGALSFIFDGKRLSGRRGDTVASALLANGIRVVGRSFKYHRPRGVWGFWTEEPNAVVDIVTAGERQPNARATTEPLQDGMIVSSVNAMPNAQRDRLGMIDRFGRFLPAGFYYKTFLWPDWRLFEPRIRAMAGLGHLDPAMQPFVPCSQRNAHCDVLVVGAGPAGLAAAHAAAAEGRRVVIADDKPKPGGSLSYRSARIEGEDGEAWAEAVARGLAANGTIVLANATAYGVYDHNLVCIWERRPDAPHRLWRIRAREIVVAAGAIERPLVFPDNDRPGIMSAEAGLYYLKRHGVLVGDRVVIATNNGSAYEAAAALAEAGARVTIADYRDAGQKPPPGVEMKYRARITGIGGKHGVETVRIGGTELPADCLLVSGGFTPSVHLHCQARGKLRYDERILTFVPDGTPQGLKVAGAAAGLFSLTQALESGHRAVSGRGSPPVCEDDGHDHVILAAWPAADGAGRQWIDFQNDVTVKDVQLAARENFRSVEHLKRYTTLGMATDQGKTSNMNGLAAMAAISQRQIPDVGTTTYRPPFVPVPLPVIAGRRRGELFAPVRRLVLENEHRAAGARLREYGSWLRPAYYGSGEAQAEIRREAMQARRSVGIFDGSPLGKLEVIGPAAAALVDFNSYNTLSTLKPGRIRYGLMLAETGVVFDDGVTTRLDEDRFLISCSSAHVPSVHLRLEEWRQDRFDPARVVIHNLTGQWATLTATGPNSRALVKSLGLGIDLADTALPHMAFAEGRFEGKPARVARVSFTGDRSYEISVPASKASSLWKRMQEAGQALDATLLGMEALMILRAEKGFIIVGKDTDGTTLPMDIGVSGPRTKRSDEYAGKRSLFTEEALREDRARLVGLIANDGQALPTGGHAVEQSGCGQRSLGFVTSSYWSPFLERPIALGLIEDGARRSGQTLEFVHLGARFTATVVAPCFLDPAGERINA